MAARTHRGANLERRQRVGQPDFRRTPDPQQHAGEELVPRQAQGHVVKGFGQILGIWHCCDVATRGRAATCPVAEVTLSLAG